MAAARRHMHSCAPQWLLCIAACLSTACAGQVLFLAGSAAQTWRYLQDVHHYEARQGVVQGVVAVPCHEVGSRHAQAQEQSQDVKRGHRCRADAVALQQEPGQREASTQCSKSADRELTCSSVRKPSGSSFVTSGRASAAACHACPVSCMLLRAYMCHRHASVCCCPATRRPACTAT